MSRQRKMYDIARMSDRDWAIISQFVRLCICHPDLSAPDLSPDDALDDRISRATQATLLLYNNWPSQWNAIASGRLRRSEFFRRDLRALRARLDCTQEQFGLLVYDELHRQTGGLQAMAALDRRGMDSIEYVAAAQILLFHDLVQQQVIRQGYFTSDWWAQPPLYFAFLESGERTAYAAPERPAGRFLQFSCVPVDGFFIIDQGVTPLVHADVSTEQRRTRSAELRPLLAEANLPQVQMLLLDDRPPRSVNFRLPLGSWWVLGMRPDPIAGFDLQLEIATDTEAEPLPGGLTLLTRAPPRWQGALSDIFSLVHIPDARFDAQENHMNVPLVPTPSAPDSVATVDAADTHFQES